jgi:hypothetical protein
MDKLSTTAELTTEDELRILIGIVHDMATTMGALGQVVGSVAQRVTILERRQSPVTGAFGRFN